MAARQHFLKQNGRVVFKFAVTQMVESVTCCCSGMGSPPADIALVVPHQANQRILDAVAERLAVPHERVASVLARYGNTTGATLPLALDAAMDERKIKRSDLVIFTAVGRVSPPARRWCGGGSDVTAASRENSAAVMVPKIGLAQRDLGRARGIPRVVHGTGAGDHDHGW